MKKMLLVLITLVLVISCTSAEEYSVFMKDDLYGIINNEQIIVFEPTYDRITINSNSIICWKDIVVEIFNKNLELLFSDSWVNISYFNENQIMIKKSMTAKIVLLDLETGSLQDYEMKNNYSEENGYRGNLGLVWRKNDRGYSYSIVDTEGNVILSDIEDAHSCYTDGMIAVILKDGKSGFVNTKGELVIETSFYIDPSDIGPRKYPIIPYLFYENYALVKNAKQKWVQYNIEGKIKDLPKNIEPAEYSYENGLVLVINTETQKYGYMNPKLKIVIPCEFSYAESFVGKYAIVEKDGKDAVIDKKGRIYYCSEFKTK